MYDAEREKALKKTFILAKYYITALDERSTVWEIITHPLPISTTTHQLSFNPATGVEVSREEAADIIEEYDMIRVMRNEHGELWELPGLPYKMREEMRNE